MKIVIHTFPSKKSGSKIWNKKEKDPLKLKIQRVFYLFIKDFYLLGSLYDE